MVTVYNWKRYWCPREGVFNLSDGGYLVDPDGKYGRILAKDVRPYTDIATTPCLILLGEPGIGKTTALEEIAASESAEYETLKVDLGEYSSDDRLFRHVFESEAIRAWLAGTYTLSIIIDSLDECRVAGIAKVLSRELVRMPTERMRLRIACRTAEWRITLEEALRSAWGKENIGVYELAPLTKANVAEAATKSGPLVDEFMNEIARVRAQPLAIKPVSLNFLLNLFRKNRCFPADEHSLYMQGCLCLCEDSQERQDAGVPHACDTPHRFAIAQRVAYLTIFAGKFAIWTGPQDGSMPPEDLSASSILGSDICNGSNFDVTDEVLHDTLNTGLFTSRGAYRMGWAHQTYAEFLSAQYILTHLDEKQRRSLLLLTDTLGADVVPQLSEVAARVATSDDSLFNDILKKAPHVLLRSDVATADYTKRAGLLSSILEKCDSGDIQFRDVYQLDRLRHLNHPDIAAQLKPFVTQTTFSLHARVLALETLEACGTDTLTNELLDLTLDETANIELRCSALGILSHSINDEVAKRIRSLAEDRAEDPGRRIKGHTLRALWPKFLSSKELFELLTHKDLENLISAYDSFLSQEIVDTLRPQDMPAALAWVKEQGRRIPLDISFQRLLDGVLIKAWDMLDEPGMLPLLADTLGSRLITDHGHIMDTTEFQDSDFLLDDRKRRLLITEMVTKVQDVDDGPFYLSNRCANIARSSDFTWLVNCAIAAPTEVEAQVWAKLCRWNYNIGTVAETDTILSVYGDNAVIRAEFAPLVEPIEIDSPKASELRDEYTKYSYFDRRREEPPLLDPPPPVRVQRLLDRCEAGEARLWWCVARELTLEPRSTHYNEKWDPDITDLPGWREATGDTQNRIREAAKLYILYGDDLRGEWVNKGSTILHSANAGYQALRLIHASEPIFIKKLPADVWARWAAALLYHPLNLSKEESTQFHEPFVSQMFSVAPIEATEALEIIIARENKQSGFLTVLSRVEHVQCFELTGMLKRLISEKKLEGSAAAQVLHCLITQDVPNTTDWIRSLIPSPVPQDGLDRDYALGAAEALCLSATQETWPTIWTTMNEDTEFGRNLVGRLGRFASFLRSDTHHLAGLTDEQLSNLYIWVSREFPHREDPYIDGAHAVSNREQITHWRDQYLLQLLKNRGTESACNAIRGMMAQLPELPWLRFSWLDAVKAMRSQTWQPLDPSALRLLAETSNSRAVSSEDDLLHVIKETLDRLQYQLSGQTAMVKLLWDFQRAKKTWCPKDEKTLSDFVAVHLRRELREKSIVVNREVEIRPLRGTQTGQETDILVEALSTSAKGDPDAIQVIIETKGCWNTYLHSDMQSQLVERYLADNQCQHGLYLVGYFHCKSWDDGDYRKKQCSEDMDTIVNKLNIQAEAMSGSGRVVVARILDLRL